MTVELWGIFHVQVALWWRDIEALIVSEGSHRDGGRTRSPAHYLDRPVWIGGGLCPSEWMRVSLTFKICKLQNFWFFLEIKPILIFNYETRFNKPKFILFTVVLLQKAFWTQFRSQKFQFTNVNYFFGAVSFSGTFWDKSFQDFKICKSFNIHIL